MITPFLFIVLGTTTMMKPYANGSKSCIAVPPAKNRQCNKCARGYQWWPCDTDLCKCDDDVSTGGVSVRDSSSKSCTAIPQKLLPRGSLETNDKECVKCGEGYKWWPCNKEPPICECDADIIELAQTPPPSIGPSSSPTRSARPSTVPSASPSGLVTIQESPITKCEAEFFSKCSSKSVCEANLGAGLSEATGKNTLATFPTIQTSNIQGRDDSVAVLVGGNYRVVKGAEIEGKIVVLGDFTIESAANFHSLVRVGAGSQVVPNNEETAILVGGDLDVQIRTVSFMQAHVAYGNIVHKGENLGSGPIIDSPSSVIQDPSADLGQFERALCDVKGKSEHWATLPNNGIVAEEGGANIVFSAGSDDCVQVFSVNSDRLFLKYGMKVVFDKSMKGKTALINVAADSDGNASIGNLADFEDSSGRDSWNFSSDATANILWNFYNATDVNLGCGVHGNGEFRGSILVPTPCSNVDFCFPGHSGRVIVNGDLTQNRAGSEFHNYEYDPVCPLPEPQSYSTCA